MNDKLRFAIIGAGSHAQSHYSDILSNARIKIELTAACDLQRSKLDEVIERYSIPAGYTDYSEMLRCEKLDGVIIVLRPMEMTKVALDCIDYGLPVLIEKPPGCNYKEAKQILDASIENDTKVMVSLNRRFFPIIQYVKSLIGSDSIISSSATYNKYNMIGDSWKWPSHLTVADAIHTIDLTCYFAGKPKAVYSISAQRDSNFVNSASGIIEFQNNAFATIDNHQCVGFRKQLFEVHTMRVSAYLDLSDEKNPVGEIYVDNKAVDFQTLVKRIGTNYSEHAHFADWITGNIPDCISDLGQVMDSVKVSEAIAEGYKGNLDNWAPSNSLSS